MEGKGIIYARECKNKPCYIGIFACFWLPCFWLVVMSVCCGLVSEIDGQRRNLLGIKPSGHHLHHRMLHIADLVGLHDCGKDLCIKAIDGRDALVCTVLAVAGDAFARQILAIAKIGTGKQILGSCRAYAQASGNENS